MKNENKKLVIKTILIVLLVEFIILVTGGIYIYKNYKKISKAASGVAESSKLENLKIKEIKIDEIVKENKNKSDSKEGTLYKGLLGEIVKNEKSNLGDNKNEIIYKYNTNLNIELNKNNITLFTVLKTLNEEKILDKFIYSYYLNKYLDNNKENKNKIKEILKRTRNLLTFAVELDYISTDQADKIFKEINNNIINNYKQIIQYLNNKKFKELAEYLQNLEKIDNIKDNILGTQKIVSQKEFLYIINKLLSNNYYNYIKEASRKTGIDIKLILSAIATEQLRYMFSERAYAKQLLMQNKFLTNFSKFSYGLGGIKTKTFINIDYWLKKYEPYIYNKYFLYYDNLAKIDKDKLQGLIEEGLLNPNDPNFKYQIYNEDKIIGLLKKHDVGTLYVAGLILTIIDKWKNAGIDISDKPGIILTLYNFGNTKTPHKNPGIGGSSIPVSKNKEKKYFGEVGNIFYNYIDLYLDLK